MNKETEQIDTEDAAHCPNYDCPYVLFQAHQKEGDYYCMECSELFDEDEVI